MVAIPRSHRCPEVIHDKHFITLGKSSVKCWAAGGPQLRLLRQGGGRGRTAFQHHGTARFSPLPHHTFVRASARSGRSTALLTSRKTRTVLTRPWHRSFLAISQQPGCCGSNTGGNARWHRPAPLRGTLLLMAGSGMSHHHLGPI